MQLTLNSLDLRFFGSSHAQGLGLVISGLPQGLNLIHPQIQLDLERRRAGKELTSKRKEKDQPIFLSGEKDKLSTGEPLLVYFENSDVRSKDYEQSLRFPRPSHADYPAYVRYKGTVDMSGGGPFSGRMMLPLVYAGALLKQVLDTKGILVASRLVQVGRCISSCIDAEAPEKNIDEYKRISQKDGTPYFDCDAQAFAQEIKAAQTSGDSVGGRIQTLIFGLPVGIGGPLFEGLESKFSQVLFGIPGVKGVSFGKGFELCGLSGSSANDGIAYKAQSLEISHLSNNMGGIDGGMSNGMPIVIHTALKPTPTIYLEQQTVDLLEHKNSTQSYRGRHDPCIALRANVVTEAACALVLASELI